MSFDFKETLVEPIVEIVEGFVQFIPNILGAVIVLVVGWGVAKVLKIIAKKLVFALHLERFADKLKIARILEKGDIRDSIAEQFSKLIFWIVILISTGISADILRWQYLSDFIQTVLSYVPKIILALIIIIIAGFVGSFIGGIVRVKTSNIKRVNSYLVGKITQYVIVGIAVVMALERLGLSTPFFIIAISIMLFGVVLAVAIATGLALKERVSDVIETSVGEGKHIVLEDEEEKEGKS